MVAARRQLLGAASPARSSSCQSQPQGRLMGLMTSAGSLGRFLGPALAVLPLPLTFSEMPRPLTGEMLTMVHAGYLQAFTAGAALVGASLGCILLLKVPAAPVEDSSVGV